MTAGKWTFTASAEGITHAHLEIVLPHPVTTIDQAMTHLSNVAWIESTAPRPERHGEPL